MNYKDFYKDLLTESVDIDALRKLILTWPKLSTGDKSGDLVVRDHIPNISSISASLTDWEEYGVRDVPMSIFGGSPGEVELANKIQWSGELNPLIVVIDGHDDGIAYILEGMHRFKALMTLKVKSFPALVCLDTENEYV